MLVAILKANFNKGVLLQTQEMSQIKRNVECISFARLSRKPEVKYVCVVLERLDANCTTQAKRVACETVTEWRVGWKTDVVVFLGLYQIQLVSHLQLNLARRSEGLGFRV